MKCLGTNLSKIMKDLHSNHDKASLRGAEEMNLKAYTLSMGKRNQYHKDSHTAQKISVFKAIPSKFQLRFQGKGLWVNTNQIYTKPQKSEAPCIHH